MDFLSGKKTYIVAFITAATALYQVLGPIFHIGDGTVPEWIYGLEGALGLGAMRVAIGKQP